MYCDLETVALESTKFMHISTLIAQASTSGEGASEAQGPNMQRFVQQLSGQVMLLAALQKDV